ncbi:MAG: hypothetical protein J6P72_08370 [Firmicutes bacterium]|nr:hypothetical protein [Bacillota bacterium]
MQRDKIETVQGLCVIALTKHIMEKYSISEDKAYAKLLGSDLYSLLMDPETNLFLETNQYLCKACDIELDEGVDALYRYINQE